MNKTLLIIVVALIVIAGGYFLLRGGYQAPAPTIPEVTAPAERGGAVSEVKEITVIGTEFAFNPSTISVTAGEKVKLIFKNEGRAPHNWIIEGLGIGTKTIGGGDTDTIEFTAPASGTYTILCSISGHRAAGMVGSLKVE